MDSGIDVLSNGVTEFSLAVGVTEPALRGFSTAPPGMEGPGPEVGPVQARVRSHASDKRSGDQPKYRRARAAGRSPIYTMRPALRPPARPSLGRRLPDKPRGRSPGEGFCAG